MTAPVRAYVEDARRQKLAELRERGIEPFPYGFERTHTTTQAVAEFGTNDPVTVRVAGRIAALRPHGKTTFGHVQDHEGRLQFMARKDELGDDVYQLLKLFDLGDHIGIEGVMFATKTGETSVRVQSIQLLAKALRPLPMGKEDAEGVQRGALTDPETRYRERYADLAVHAETRDVFRIRAQTISFLREFLDARGYVEVETPVLQPLYGGALTNLISPAAQSQTRRDGRQNEE